MRTSFRVARRVVPTLAVAALLAACAAPADRTPPALTTERIAAIVASPDRSAADRTNDVRRKPVEMLAFIGVRPGMVALDVFAGGGYTSELLARSVAPDGYVYAQSAPAPVAPMPIPAPASAGGVASAAPDAPPRRTSAMAIAERARNPAASNMTPVLAPFSNPVPSYLANGSLDLVTLMFNYHDFGYMGVDRAAMNRAIYAALKPGGLYVIADHAGRSGTGISESNTLHRIEEDFLVREVEAAGFKLAARGDFLRSPDDPRDREDPPPPIRKDEFVVKFVKPRS